MNEQIQIKNNIILQQNQQNSNIIQQSPIKRERSQESIFINLNI